MSGSRRSSTTQSTALVAQVFERLRAGAGRHDLDVVMVQQRGDAELLGRIVLDHQQALAARLDIGLDLGERGLRRPRPMVGLGTKEKAPRARPCWRSSSRVTICTGMCRVFGFCLSWLSTVQPSMSGRKMSSDTAVGLVFARQVQRVLAARRDQHLEAFVMREIHQDARIVRIVLDDQQHGVAGRDVVAVVGDLLDHALGQGGEREAALGHRLRPTPARRRWPAPT